jgi:ferrochelatase
MLAMSIRGLIALLISFHGVPRATLLAGDPYYCHCLKTARLVADELGLPYYNADANGLFSERRVDPSKRDEVDFGISFQSRFGFAEWVRPYSDATLDEWGKAGVERVDVVAPAFSADCLETLEEITMQLAETFKHAGGKRLRYIPALNADDAAMRVLRRPRAAQHARLARAAARSRPTWWRAWRRRTSHARRKTQSDRVNEQSHVPPS